MPDARVQTWRHGPPGEAGVFADFDGTLSAIVDDPYAARPLPGAVDALASLVARYAMVAVVSGRPAAFLADWLPVPGLRRWGLYGLEVVTDRGDVEIDPAAEPWVDAMRTAAAAAQAEAPPGLVVEPKGVGLGLHWREAPGDEGWARRFAADVAASAGLVVHEAKMSVELLPPLRIDKGTVVAAAVETAGLAAACFVGDDVGDMSAFRALDGVARPLRVAVRSLESPATLLEAADVVVDGPAGALDLLRDLA
jgi:trehalose 6-phosphate phosphatase